MNRWKKDPQKYPDRVILGSETFAADAAVFFDLTKGHPALIGDFGWTGMDCLGEGGPGAWEYREYARPSGRLPPFRRAGAVSNEKGGSPPSRKPGVRPSGRAETSGSAAAKRSGGQPSVRGSSKWAFLGYSVILRLD